MSLKRVEAPEEGVLALADVRAHCRIDTDDEDGLLEALIEAVASHLDGAAGVLGRALVTQTWDLALDAFPCGSEPIPVPLPPLQEVESITYVDAAGDTQIVSEDDYAVDTSATPGRIVPAYGASWPASREQINAVTVRFVAGYGGTDDIPRGIRLAALMLVAHWFENREASQLAAFEELPLGARALLGPYRVWGF